jgi:WD40 repeat protein/predicted transcriptional regulator
MLFLIIPFNVSNVVQAEGTEPNVNFYVERELFGHSGDVTALAWSANGQNIASGSLDNTTRIWSTGTWSTIKTFYHSAPVFGISWSKTNLRLAISYGNGTVEVYNSVGWVLLKTLSDHLDTVCGLSFSPDGTMLSTGDDLGNIKIWDTTTWNSLKDLDILSGIKELQWSNDGEKLAACSSNGTISIWDTSTWTAEQSFDATSGDESIESIAWSSDDSKLASSSGEMEVSIWNTESWDEIQSLDTESNPNDLVWLADDAYVALSVVGGMKIWNTTNWEVIPSQELIDDSQVEALSAGPEGDIILTSAPQNSNNTVIVWGKNLSPVLDPIGNQEVTEDESFFLTVSASDDDQLIFTDDSLLFDINSDSGQISFTPTNDDVGEHTVTITAYDGKGGMDNETFILTVINVDDPPVPDIRWHYGADYVNITLRIGGEIGNSVSLVIEEDDIIIDKINVEKESEYYDEELFHLDMNSTKSYETMLNYSGTSGENSLSITFEHNGFSYTKHLIFNSEDGNDQIHDLQMDDIFKAMGLILFDAKSSSDVDNIITDYSWDFGEGNVGEGVEAIHIFHENGIYIISLTVESENGHNASITTDVTLNDIPDKNDLESELDDDAVHKYLESINYKAVFLDKREHLSIVDSQGNMAGFLDGSYLFEIEDLHMAYSSDSAEIYYLPNDQEFTFNILDSDEPYELHLLIPQTDIEKVINVYGDSGGDTIKLNDENDIIIITTYDLEKNYSLRFETDGDLGKEVFLLSDIMIGNEETHYYYINNWEGFSTDPKAIALGIDRDSDGEIDISIELENGMTGEEIEIIILSKGESDSSFLNTLNLLLIVGFVGIAGLGGIIWATEVGKLALLSLILPLYTRIKKEKVLDNEIRGMIRGYIIANPGDNYNSIKRALSLNNGALAYHLKVLERAEIIKSRQDGMFKRFYPASMRIPAENGGEVSEIQKVLLNKIAESPGISQKEIAILLGLSKGVINYHVKVLLAKQLLKIEKRGRKTYCFLDEKGVSLIIDNSDIKNIG